MADIENKPGEVADKSKSRTAMMLAARPAIFAALAKEGFDMPAAINSKDGPTLRRFLRALVHIGLQTCLDAGASPKSLAEQLCEALHNELEERKAKVEGNLAEAKQGGAVVAFPVKGGSLPN